SPVHTGFETHATNRCGTRSCILFDQRCASPNHNCKCSFRACCVPYRRCLGFRVSIFYLPSRPDRKGTNLGRCCTRLCHLLARPKSIVRLNAATLCRAQPHALEFFRKPLWKKQRYFSFLRAEKFVLAYMSQSLGHLSSLPGERGACNWCCYRSIEH